MLAALLALVGGTTLLFLGGSGGGLARFQGKNFVIGAIVGGVADLFVGGMLGAKTAGLMGRRAGDSSASRMRLEENRGLGEIE